jgi:hypothetical protein
MRMKGSLLSMSLKLRTSLPDNECLERLKIALKPEYIGTHPKQLKPLIGQVHVQRFTARKRRRYTHNMFEPIFFGRISIQEQATLITGTFRMDTLVIVILVLGAIPFIYEAIKAWSLLPVSTLPIIYGLVCILYLADLPNKDYIREHLLEILVAEEVRSTS